MVEKQKSNPVFSYDAHARTCAPDDFLGQVRRTVNGAPVSSDQIEMILAAIDAGLTLEPDDVLLELACGNGALSCALFGDCKGYMGVDCSDYLISVAKRHFERLPDYRFEVGDALAYLRGETAPLKFTKALCYASFQYFSDTEAAEVLRILKMKFSNLKQLFIGNMPNKDNAAKFYRNRTPGAEELADNRTAIGVWRTPAELTALAHTSGWSATSSIMPPAFQSAYYRFDAILTR